MRLTARIVTILISFFIFLTGISNTTFAGTQEHVLPFNVLIINSYHIGHYWESFVMEGFETAAEEFNKDEINIKVEYFDFRNRNDEVYISSFIELIEKKYPKGSVHAIYAVDDEAFGALLPEITKESSELYHVPLLFSGLDSDISLTEEEKKYVTGIYQGDVTLEVFNLLLQLDDTVDCINIITENSGFGENLINKATNIVTEHMKNEITLNIIQSDYIEDIEAELEVLKSKNKNSNGNEAIIVGGEFQYKGTNVFLDPKESINRIKNYLPWPIYTNDPTYLSADILGGCMDIGQLQGMEIFNIIRRMIGGEDIIDIGSCFAPSPKFILKYDSIYKNNINVNNIPRKCMIIDKKFYELLIPNYMKNIIRGIVLGIFALVIFLITKIMKMVKANKAHKRESEMKIAREKMQIDFIVNISHELRTPINIILAGVSVIKLHLKAASNEKEIKYLEEKLNTINRNAYRLLKLSNNIIDVKKIETGTLTLNKKNVDIVEMVESIFIETINYANKKNLKMIFDTIEEEILILIDVELIERVVLNILSNAIKFTPDGGVIWTRIKKDKGDVVIEIEDTGIGIEKEKLERIFYRFYQVDNSLSRSNEGSGIGLSIVKELVKLHNGKIDVQSEVGKGTRVSVFLPVVCYSKVKDTSFRASVNSTVNTELADVVK